MKVRAKFKCDSVQVSGSQTNWNFGAVYANNDPAHENSKFWKYTPAGQLSMSLNNDEYQGPHPVVGKEYYLDISEA